MIVTSEKELRKISEKVDLTEGRKIALELEEQLRKSHNGIGLAAPQMGIHKRVIVVHANDYIHFVNPRITKKDNPFIHKNEGCLSFPGIWINTLRYRDVVIEDDLHGTTEFHQLAALVAAHEIDHLDGILFFDREIPKPYDACICDSGKKFKFCCYKKLK